MTKRKKGFNPSRLKEARSLSGLSQEEIASELGIQQNQYSRYENGGSEPSGYLIKRMATALNVTTDYLFGLVETPRSALLFDDLTEDEKRLIFALRSRKTDTAIRIIANAVKPGE